jgi:hypothetical protein
LALDPTLVAIIILSWFLNIILDIAAAWYCYRMTRITGGFRAWWLLIIFTILFAVSSFTSAGYTVVSSSFQASANVSAAATSAALFGIGLQVILSILLFVSMFELYKILKSNQKM